MKKWPGLSELFALHPLVDDIVPAGTVEESHRIVHQQKIRFDNTVRVWIALPTFLACAVLWIQKVIPALTPIVSLFSAYAVVQLGLNWYFMDSRYSRVC